MEHYIHEWPRKKKDASGVIIAVVSAVGICLIAFTLMSVANYHGADYSFGNTWWGEICIKFSRFLFGG